MIQIFLRLRGIQTEVLRHYLECAIPNMKSVWSMSDKEVQELPEFRQVVYKEYLKFLITAQVASFFVLIIFTIPPILIKNFWWPLYLQLGMFFIIGTLIFRLLYKIRKTNQEIMIKEIMES